MFTRSITALVASVMLLLCTFSHDNASAQISSAHLDTLIGGQLTMIGKGKVIILPHHHVTLRSRYSYGPSFTTSYLSLATHTLADTGSIADTVALTDTTHVSIAGTYFVDWVVYDSLGNDTSNFYSAYVDSVWGSPTFSVGTIAPTSDGGIAPITYNCNGPAGTLYVYESPGDTSYTSPALAGIAHVTGAGITNFTFAGLFSGEYYSFKFKFVTSMDSILTPKMWNRALTAPAAATISSVDSFTTDTTSIRLHNLLVSLNTATVTIHYGVHGTPLNDSVVATNPGGTGAVSIWSNVTGLIQGTLYDFKVCARNSMGGMCTSVLFTAGTTVPPAILSTRVDSLWLIDATTEGIRIRTTVPAGMIADVGGLLTTGSDTHFALPLSSPPLTTVTSGITYTYVSFTGLVNGQHLRVGAYAVPSSGPSVGPDTGVVFTFTVPAPMIDSFFATPTHVPSSGGRTHFHFVWSGVHAEITPFVGNLTTHAGSALSDSITATTTYTITVTGVDSTVVTRAITVTVDTVVDTTTFVPTFVNKVIQVYPNPAMNEITVRGAQNSTIQIFDMVGHSISTSTATSGEQIITVANLPSGQYLLSIRNGINNSMENFRFVVQR